MSTRSPVLASRSHFRVTLDIPGFPLTGAAAEFDTWTGGSGSADVGQTRQGTSSAKTQVIGGPPTYADFTVTRGFDYATDWTLYLFLEGKQGLLGITCHRQPLDINDDPFGNGQTGLWTLGEVTIPDYDTNSSDVGNLSLILRAGSWSA